MSEHVGERAVPRRVPAGASDSELVARAQAGDHLAFASLLRRYDDGMRRLAFRLLADDSAMDDVLREAYGQAYRALPEYRPGARFKSWLYRITYDACIDELRRGRRPSRGRRPRGRAVTAAETVRSALADLPPEQRLAVVLVDGEGFESSRVARILGIPQETVASRLSRARLQLRHAIEGSDLANR